MTYNYKITLEELLPICDIADDAIINITIYTKEHCTCLNLRKNEMTKLLATDVLKGRISLIRANQDTIALTVRTYE